MAKEKPLTINSLARIVSAGFDSVQNQLNGMEHKLENLENSVITKLELHDQFEMFTNHFEKRLQRIEEKRT
ncbi:MAG: hypothetical protein AAB691_03395 [Patescibacteria group bacterium]